MGQITISTNGSFGNDTETFTAVYNGHADAVAQAIEYISKKTLPEAIALDHKLHDEGSQPIRGFDRNKP